MRIIGHLARIALVSAILAFVALDTACRGVDEMRDRMRPSRG